MIKSLSRHFACPNDSNPLIYKKDHLYCERCEKRFPIIRNNLVEILPDKPIVFHGTDRRELDYFSEYRKCFSEPFTWMEHALSWGILDMEDVKSIIDDSDRKADNRFHNNPIQNKKYKQFISYRLRAIQYLFSLMPNRMRLFCDISGGAGGYSRKAAKICDMVVHCDLDVENINYVYNKFNHMRINNVIFVRCDYLQPPFQAKSFDFVICMDTMMRGPIHEKMLLKNLLMIKKQDGHVYCDFHNLWHNPINYLLKKGFDQINFSYSYRMIRKLLKDLAVHHYQRYSFIQEIPHHLYMYPIADMFMPPTFNIIRC